MGRLIALIVAIGAVPLAGVWGYRLVGPHLTESQAGEAALAASINTRELSYPT